MTLLDTTIVNVAMPSMITGLTASLNDIIWVNSAYLLAFAVPLLLTGRLGDKYGPRRVYLIGLVLFTLSSLACGLAPNATALIVARAFQGLGAAAMTPQTMAFITYLFPPDRRGAALGTWGSVAGIATTAGPLLGGVLVTHLGWEWIFFVNLPIGVVALTLVLLWVPDYQPGRSHRFDLLGVALCVLGLGLLVFGIQNGEHYQWGRVFGPITIAEIIAAGLVLLVLFVLWQAASKRNPEPLLPLRIFRNRNFSLGNIANVGIGFVVAGFFVPLVLFVQTVAHLTPLEAGLLTAPTSAVSGLVAFFAGRRSNGARAKYLPIAGFVMLALGIGVVALQLDAQQSQWVMLPALVVVGLGMATVFSPLTNITTRTLEPPLMGAGAGIFNTARQFGTTLGTAATGAVLQVTLAATGDFTTATRAAMFLLVVAAVTGLITACFLRPIATVRDSARASDPGLPVTRPS